MLKTSARSTFGFPYVEFEWIGIGTGIGMGELTFKLSYKWVDFGTPKLIERKRNLTLETPSVRTYNNTKYRGLEKSLYVLFDNNGNKLKANLIQTRSYVMFNEPTVLYILASKLKQNVRTCESI